MRKGISLVSLMIMMVVMIIIVSTVTISGVGTFNNNKKLSFATEISMVQNAVDTYFITNGEYPIDAEFNLNISKVSEKAKAQFEQEVVQENTVALYKLDYSKLGITSLKYGAGAIEDGDVYALSKVTGKVYYAKGVNVGSITYYTLTDDLKKMIRTNEDGNVNDGIIFSVSTADWTQEPVKCTVKIPATYSVDSVKVNGSIDIEIKKDDNGIEVKEDGYHIYEINNDSSSYDCETNYIVDVSYSKSAEESSTSVQYVVDNIDTEPPVLEIDESNSENIIETEDGVEVYLNIAKCVDSQSGIKYLKYDYGEHDAQYFENNGLKVYDNSVEIEKATETITVYTEDNAGWYAINTYKLSDNTYAKLLEKDYTLDKNPTEYVNGTLYTAYIPEGFYYVGGEVTTGLVISDNIVDRNKGTSFDVASTLKGNQFVWVPVNYIMKTQTLKLGISSFSQLRTGWNTSNDANQIITLNSRYEEPYSSAPAWEDLEYGEMFSSITKYGGFYVARFEARDLEATTSRTSETSARKVGSKIGPYIYNHVKCAENIATPEDNSAIALSHNMYKNSNSVVSHLIYGVQWDILMYWAIIEGKDLNSLEWGNYNSGTLYSTSNPENHSKWVTNNIYDLAGNAFEWTMESYVDATNNVLARVIRGGSYSQEGTNFLVVYRSAEGWKSNSSSVGISFRIALYLK